MAHLGEFGRAVAEYEGEADTFTFYGEVFEIPARLSGVVMLRFADEAKQADAKAQAGRVQMLRAEAELERATTDEERAAARAKVEAGAELMATATSDGGQAQRRFLRSCIGDEQADRFEAVAEANGASVDELLYVAGMVYATVTGRPTRRPSDSSDGPSSTGDGSTAASGSPAETGGPSRPSTGSPVTGTVVEMNPAARQAAEFRRLMEPVSLVSGG